MKRLFTSKIYFFALFLFLNLQQSFSFEEVTITDARALSMGHLHALSREFSNPAALSFLPGSKVSAALHNRFQMSELNTALLQVLLPNRFVDTGFRFVHFGYEDYNCLSLQTGFSKRISERFSIGTKICFIYLNNFLNEKSQTGFKAGFGGIFHLSTPIKICFSAENIASTFKEKDYSAHIGIDYQCLPNLNLSSEISFTTKNQINVSLGSEYQIVDELYFRAGFQTYFSTPSLGIAYAFQKIEIGATFTTHQLLGNSSMIEVSYSF